MKNLSLLPTCGTKFYQHASGWRQLYSEDFTETQKEKIIEALKQATGPAQSAVENVWGELIEDRGSQITFSALGQKAPLDAKKNWDPDFSKRNRIKVLLDEQAGTLTIKVRDPHETKRVIEAIAACLGE